jgi:hypothetical protein
MRRLLLGVALLLPGACQTPAAQYGASLEAALREGTPAALQKHRELLVALLDEAEAGGHQVWPGVRVELACCLAALGEREQALALLQKERELYPQAAAFLAALEKKLTEAPR